MIEHVVRNRSKFEWDVVALGKGIASDVIVETHGLESIARARMQELNRLQMGRPTAPVIGPEAVKQGCTCARGVMLPGDPPCPVHP